MYIATLNIHSLTTDKAGSTNQHSNSFTDTLDRAGDQCPCKMAGAGTAGSILGWNRALCPVLGGREPLWGLAGQVRTSGALRAMTSTSEKTYSSEVLHKSLKGICLFTRKIDNIRNNYFSWLNRVTINSHNKTYSTVSHLLKCACITKFYA